MAGRADAFNPAELLLASLAACILKGTERVRILPVTPEGATCVYSAAHATVGQSSLDPLRRSAERKTNSPATAPRANHRQDPSSGTRKSSFVFCSITDCPRTKVSFQ
jgi:hypothetical protein